MDQTIEISAAGMTAQTARLRVIAQNIANADTTGQGPGADPYRRKAVTFASQFDRAVGAETVRVAKVAPVPGDFEQRFNPSHPAADAKGYVKLPNIDTNIEMMDMREAQQSYAANLAVLDTTRSMQQRTIDSLR